MTYSAVLLNGEAVGPVSVLQLQDFASRGLLAPDTPVTDENGIQLRADALDLIFSAPSDPRPQDPPQGEPPPTTFATTQVKSAKPFPWGLVIAGVLVLFAVGCIIGVAALIPVFVYGNMTASQNVTMTRIKDIGTSLQIYISDFDGVYPPDMSSGAAVQPYLRTYSRDLVFESLNKQGKDLLGNPMLSGKNSLEVSDPANTMTLFDSADWPNQKRITGLVDGSARQITSKEYEEATGRGFVLR